MLISAKIFTISFTSKHSTTYEKKNQNECFRLKKAFDSVGKKKKKNVLFRFILPTELNAVSSLEHSNIHILN